MSKNQKNILVYSISIVMVSVFVFPFLVQAQSGGNPPAGGGNPATGPIVIANPFKANTIQDLIKSIVDDILMPIGGVVAVVMIMYAGFLFVTAGGEPGQITKAKDALLWGVIGAAILLGAWVISTAISTTIDQLKT
jgi:hypothetical protein